MRLAGVGGGAAGKRDHGRAPLRIEGITEQQWVLIAFGDVVVHVFSEEIRA